MYSGNQQFIIRNKQTGCYLSSYSTKWKLGQCKNLPRYTKKPVAWYKLALTNMKEMFDWNEHEIIPVKFKMIKSKKVHTYEEIFLVDML